MTSFTHLHVHTEYSLLDGLASPKELVAKAKEFGMDAVAITDHGNMFGAIDFYKEAKKEGIKPIIGCEVYTAARGMTDKDAVLDRTIGHLVLLAETNEGYKNLIKIVSAGYTDGFYYKPRVDRACLREHSNGLIALSACLAGDVPRALLKNWQPKGEGSHMDDTPELGGSAANPASTSNLRYDAEENFAAAKAEALELESIFGKGNFFLEVQNQGLEEEAFLYEPMKRLSAETGIPLVATNDVHYLRREDAKAHDVLLCIQTGKRVSDTRRMRFSGDQFYFRSPEEMGKAFPDLKDALERTSEIAARCNVEIDFGGRHLPDFTAPAGKENAAYLRELCEQGLKERYGDKAGDYQEKLGYELSVIENMGFVEYFLIVWDFIKYAKDTGVPVGPGRGSAAGSIVAYTLHITDIDPVRYGLIFERFLNPERVSMPDIDIDFSDERRGEVIDYVIAKYGEKNVAQIITFGTMKAKAVVRDVARVLDMSYEQADRIAKLIPNELDITLDEALKIEPKLNLMCAQDPAVKELFEYAKVLEGKARHAGTHAAGVVITKKATDEYVPLFNSQKGISTQWTMTTVEQLGLLKMDFLGLTNLSVIDDAIHLVEKNYGEKIDFSKHMDMDDDAVYKLIADGDTDGVFQLENPGMREFMKKMRPKEFEDIVVGISLYRPGPMDNIPDYLRNRSKPAAIKYADERLRPILAVTYGIIVYQEQVMQIVRELAGYDYGRSDEIRRAMSKKKESEMLKQREYFINGIHGSPDGRDVPGCVKNGVPERVANKLFDDMVAFASYAFNKSHAAAYAVVAYRTAYLKAHFPKEFMAALMSAVMGHGPKIAQYIRNCKEKGVELLPPDVMKSERKFSVEDGKIRMGLGSVKNCGDGAIECIINWRNTCPNIRGMRDFVSNIDPGQVNSKAAESLIYAGAFDSVCPNRRAALADYKLFSEQKKKEQGRITDGQKTLFDIIENEAKPLENASLEPDFDEKTKLELEKEVLGVYLSGHPLDEYKEVLEMVQDKARGYITSEQLNNPDEFPARNGDADVIIAGQVTDAKVMLTKKGQQMAKFLIEDLAGTASVIVFPSTYEKTDEAAVLNGAIVVVRGKEQHRQDEEACIIASKITPIESVREFYDERRKKDA